MRRFTAAHRRLEWLAVRVLLYTLSGEEKEIAYHPSGKPYLADDSASISISHTKGYVAVALGLPGREVGVDIEQYGAVSYTHLFEGRIEQVAQQSYGTAGFFVNQCRKFGGLLYFCNGIFPMFQ